ncbi:hypothetical protein [Catenuloplanes japonicus]|uniref:hypothetical protein n=1 Tax=Catenuloplanes japonicus TaxID=33876 RepID=UPI0005253A9B|nr:hypothetical protein [Catenuloplanes japonicus]
MYAWIWRKLPYGTSGKIAGSLLITGVLVAVLWFAVFPWVEPIVFSDEVQVGDDYGTSTQNDPLGGDGTPAPTDEHAIPYDTQSNNPEPTAS